MLSKDELKYPIKYATMPIINQSDWIHELLKQNEIVTYIVSKCYVVSETKKYSANGNITQTYEVVFPYSNNYSKIWNHDKIIPIFTDNFEKCTNSILVGQLFDSFEEVVQVVNQKNKEIISKIIMQIPYSEKFKEISKMINTEFNENLKANKNLETEIEKETRNMIITQESCINSENPISQIESPTKDSSNSANMENKEPLGRKKILKV